MRKSTIISLLTVLFFAPFASADEHPFYFGGDISSLPDLEKFGAVYRDNGKPGDAITILTSHGCNLFRVRLFVDPDPNFDKTGGATQNLQMVLALCKRIKIAGGKISIAIHYSDTWADPAHQSKPAAWKDLPLDALTQKVTEYTTGVMQALKSNGTPPEIVEVGNETTAGMLWPDGKLDGKTADEKQLQWDHYAALEKAGIKAVRAQLPTARILLHIDGGGRPKPIPWFSALKKYNLDFDIIGLSFYPTWKDSMPGLKKNLTDLADLHKDILVIETGYPSRPMNQNPATTWPMTPDGQKEFLNELISTVKQAPEHHGIGVVWWYPEAQPLEGHRIWDGGSQGWFDLRGNLQPAASVLK